MKRRSDNRQAQSHLHGHGETLNNPKDDQHPDVPGQPEQQGCTGEAGQTGEKNPFVAQQIGCRTNFILAGL